MTRIMHVADSSIGYIPQDLPARMGDLMAGISRSIDAAIFHDVDVYLHSGGLFSHEFEAGTSAKDVPWGDELLTQFSRLRTANIGVVIFDAKNQHFDQFGFDENTLIMKPGGAINANVAGIRFTGYLGTESGASLQPDVFISYGRLGAHGGRAYMADPIDENVLMAACRRSTYVALGGMNRCQAIAPNCCYAGITAGTVPWHGQHAGGILVEIGDSSKKILRLHRVIWPDRPLYNIQIDAGGFTTLELGGILVQELSRIVTHTDADEQAQVIQFKICGANMSLEDLLADPTLALILNARQCLYVEIRWCNADGELIASHVVRQ